MHQSSVCAQFRTIFLSLRNIAAYVALIVIRMCAIPGQVGVCQSISHIAVYLVLYLIHEIPVWKQSWNARITFILPVPSCYHDVITFWLRCPSCDSTYACMHACILKHDIDTFTTQHKIDKTINQKYENCPKIQLHAHTQMHVHMQIYTTCMDNISNTQM
jgi:hypothetical protein